MSRPITENTLNWAVQKFFWIFLKHLAKYPFSDSRSERTQKISIQIEKFIKSSKNFFENTLRNDLSPILRMRGQCKTSHMNLENWISHPREILLILNVHPACLVRENTAEIWGRNGLGQNGKAQITADTMRRSVERWRTGAWTYQENLCRNGQFCGGRI